MPRNWVHTVSISALLLASSACTQQAAQVDFRGAGDFGPGATMAYNSNDGYRPQPVNNFSPAYKSAVSMNTVSNAHVQSISSSDLAPPSAAPREVASNITPNTLSPASGSTVKGEEPKTLGVIPFATSPTPAPAPIAQSQPVAVAPAPATQAVETQRVNPWTKAPRGDEGAAAVEAKKEQLAENLSQAAPAAGAAKKVGFMWPVNGKSIISNFGPKTGGKVNDGINIAMNEGEPVWSSADGEVAYVGNELKGYGNMVLIKHSGNKTTTYAHLSRSTVDKYERVKQGDIIGYVGTTGNVNKPQLHFAIREGKEAVDPQKYLPRSVAGL